VSNFESYRESRVKVSAKKRRHKRPRSIENRTNRKKDTMIDGDEIDETQISENGCGGGYLQKRTLLTKALIKH